MSSAAEILVIIVSSVLSVFLIIAIILAIYLIKLTAEIRRLAKSAQSTVSHIDSAVVGVSKITSPIFVAELVGKYIKKFSKKGKK
jgi:cobalamin biosynthesis protein CobD/CbiB